MADAAVEGEDGEDGEVYCVCRKSDTTGIMLECDFCKDWFHVSAVFVCVRVCFVMFPVCVFLSYFSSVCDRT